MEVQHTQSVSSHSGGLVGRFRVPGDKSITHRALLFAAMRKGKTRIHSPSTAGDCLNTFGLIRAVGYDCREEGGGWVVDGGVRSSLPEEIEIDCGNSGTTARLGTGFLTGERGRFRLTGDASLRRRPMERVAGPLRRLGGLIETTDGYLPLTVIAEKQLNGLCGKKGEGDEFIETTSAQVHGALVLAGLRSATGVRLRRTKEMRDHTLRMAAKFGWEIKTVGDVDTVSPLAKWKDGEGRREEEIEFHIPGDLSSAAFLVTAALTLPGSDILIEDVGLNPTRIGFLGCVRAMGGDVIWESLLSADEWEPRGTIGVRYSPGLRGIDISDESPITPSSMIDELPLLAFLGSRSSGETTLRDAGELRLKESDRIAATVGMMRSLGVEIEELEDGFRISGPQEIRGGGVVEHRGDHRLAMLAGIAGLLAKAPIRIPEANVVDVSWPGFWDELSAVRDER